MRILLLVLGVALWQASALADECRYSMPDITSELEAIPDVADVTATTLEGGSQLTRYMVSFEYGSVGVHSSYAIVEQHHCERMDYTIHFYPASFSPQDGSKTYERLGALVEATPFSPAGPFVQEKAPELVEGAEQKEERVRYSEISGHSFSDPLSETLPMRAPFRDNVLEAQFVYVDTEEAYLLTPSRFFFLYMGIGPAHPESH